MADLPTPEFSVPNSPRSAGLLDYGIDPLQMVDDEIQPELELKEHMDPNFDTLTLGYCEQEQQPRFPEPPGTIQTRKLKDIRERLAAK